ncbi:hypothetical protein, partial [Streptococcus pneumoniae]|uniref:hypothetical protein n=1 Tax=Streptococcus pneumoniae TaxID=1313 RepID=UPI001C53F4D7
KRIADVHHASGIQRALHDQFCQHHGFFLVGPSPATDSVEPLGNPVFLDEVDLPSPSTARVPNLFPTRSLAM